MSIPVGGLGTDEAAAKLSPSSTGSRTTSFNVANEFCAREIRSGTILLALMLFGTDRAKSCQGGVVGCDGH